MTSNDGNARGDHRLWLLSILGGALVLRLLLFTGIQGEDDRYYYNAALHVVRNERPAPWHLFDTRVAATVPIAVLFRLFGARESCLIAPTLAASLSLVALAYAWGRRRGSAWTARTAALFVAVFPLDILCSTGSYTDPPLAAWLGLGAFLLDGADRAPTSGRRRAAAVLAGLSFLAAHFTKESALPLMAAMLPLLIRKEILKDLAVAMAVLAGGLALEMLAYGRIESDPLFRFHLAKTFQAGTPGSSDGFLDRLLWLPSFCVNPLGAAFAYTAGLFVLSIAGGVAALRKDLHGAGRIAFWWLGSGYLLALSPLTLLPFHPAVDLQPRMFAVQILPGGLLAADFLVGLAARRPRVAVGIALGSSFLALLCAARLHQDAVLFRAGPVWAHARLSSIPGAAVLTDPRTARMLQVLAADAPAYTVRAYTGADPLPAEGTWLLDCRIQAAGARFRDNTPPPSWWGSEALRQEEVDTLNLPSPWRLRGARGSGERTVLWRVAAHSPR